MKKVLIIGGANGIGLSLAVTYATLEDCEKIYIVDKNEVDRGKYELDAKIECKKFNLLNDDFSFFDQFSDIDTLIITAGFGKLSLFEHVDESYIVDSMKVNAIAVMRLIHRFYPKLHSENDFYVGVLVSISGFMSSPFFSVYGASKAALKIFIESVNVELSKAGFSNRILNVSPGAIKGTAFDKGETILSVLEPLSKAIIAELRQKNDLYIPQYDEVYKAVLQRYHDDFRAEGAHSYEYKLASGRVSFDQKRNSSTLNSKSE